MTDNTDEQKLLSPYAIAAGLIYKDIKLAPLLYIIIIFPHLLAFFLDEFPSYALLLLERACQIGFLSIITIKWVDTFKQSPAQTPTKWILKNVLIYLIIGFIVWLTIIIPFLLQILGELPPNLNGISFFLLIPAVYLLYKYFFYFFPILNGFTVPYKIMESSMSINKGESNLPVKTLIAPLGIFSLLTASLMAFSPDGRSFAVNFLISLFAGVFWFLHSYISLGAALLYWNQKDWYECKLDPYRNARLASLSISTPKKLSRLLSPRQGMAALGISLFIWFANMLTLEVMKPAAEIKITGSSIKDKNILILNLEILDKDYKFRGFQPMHFTLAGEQRAPVCDQVTSAKVKGSDNDVRFILPETSEKLNLTLEFKCARDEEAIKKLEDLHLWYRGVKLEKMKF